MAKIVGAVASTHSPLIYWASNATTERGRTETFGAFSELKRFLDERAPDVLVMIANDHVNNFFMDNMPAFCVGISEEAEGPLEREHTKGIPNATIKIAQEVAKSILKEGMNSSVDFSFSQEFQLDHAFIVPMHLLNPGMRLAMVPIFVNCLVPPLPLSSRALYVGRVIRKAIERHQGVKGVAIAASGNFSIEVGGPRMDEYDLEFEESVMDLIARCKVDDLVRLCTTDRMLKAGNASGEMLNWISLLGCIGDAKPQSIKLVRAKGWGDMPFAYWAQ